MKKVTLYQAVDDKGIANNMLASITHGAYTRVSDMEPVVMLRKEGGDEEILEDIFRIMNSNEYKYSLNYSLSVGDVVCIDSTYYRCMPIGWEVISAD